MTKTAFRWIGAGVIVLATAAGAAAQGGEEMSAEQKAAMEKWMKASTPGAEHQKLAAGAGNWSATVTMWEAPGAPPQVSQASSKRHTALGGRVLVDEWTGTMMGMPFEGLGVTGYDNAAGRWWSTWSDTMGTGLMTMTGTCDADPKKGCVYTGSAFDPMTEKEKSHKTKVFWPSGDEEHFEMYDKTPEGKEFRIMEIVSKRAR